MSSLLLENTRRLLEQSQALPNELASFQKDCLAAREQVNLLGQRADRVRAQSQQQVETVTTAITASCKRLHDQRNHLQTAFDMHQQALAGLTKSQEVAAAEILSQGSDLAQGYEALEQEMANSTSELNKASQHYAQLTFQGLQAVENAWQRLNTALAEAELQATHLTDATVQALSDEKRQLGQMAAHLDLTRTKLANDLDLLCAEASAIEQRFTGQMQQALAVEISQNADQIENSAGQNLDLGVRQRSQERIDRYLEQGVLLMGKLASDSQDRFDPPLHDLEKPVKRYARNTRLKPMMVAVYNYLMALQLEGLLAPYYPLLFGNPEDV